MTYVNCPQCHGCKDRTQNNTCRKTCFCFKIAETKAAEQKKKRAKIKKAQSSDKLYGAYEAEAIHRMQQRDWYYDYRKRRRHT